MLYIHHVVFCAEGSQVVKLVEFAKRDLERSYREELKRDVSQWLKAKEPNPIDLSKSELKRLNEQLREGISIDIELPATVLIYWPQATDDEGHLFCTFDDPTREFMDFARNTVAKSEGAFYPAHQIPTTCYV